MARVKDSLQLQVSLDQAKNSGTLCVTVSEKIVDALYNYTLQAQHAAGPVVGFGQQDAPVRFLDAYYHENLINHLKEFLLKYHVISFVYEQLSAQKIPIVGEPRLMDIALEQHKPAVYTFSITTTQPCVLHNWKRLPFKPPQRKRYQDIDKQATNFLTGETDRKKEYSLKTVSPGDWVLFQIMLTDHNKKPLIKNFSETLWLQINDEETSEPFRALFLDKKVGESFISNSACLTEYFGSQLTSPYQYKITILSIIPAAYFCVSSFKNHFRLTSDKKAHKKMIEVYSFRNDISLRRSIVEEAFALLLKTYQVQIPESTILRQEKIIFDELQQNPDYAIYKLQRDFDQKVRSLAEKQLKEQLVTLFLAIQEDVLASDADVHQYINLAQRARTKEFIHFVHPAIKANEEDCPISHASLKYYCTYEKALNHALHHLMKWSGED